jgi:hypothetical protein
MPWADAQRILMLAGRPQYDRFYDAQYLSRVASLGADPFRFVAALEYQRHLAEQQMQRPVMHRSEVSAHVDFVITQLTANAEKHGFTVGRTSHSREATERYRSALTERLERDYKVIENP